MDNVVAEAVAAVAGAAGGQGIVASIRALRMRPKLDALGDDLRTEIAKQGKASEARDNDLRAAIEAQGRELRASIEAQGRELRASIEAQGRESEARDNDLRAAIEAQGRELRASIEAQGRELRAEIRATDDRVANLLTALVGARAAVSDETTA